MSNVSRRLFFKLMTFPGLLFTGVMAKAVKQNSGCRICLDWKRIPIFLIPPDQTPAAVERGVAKKMAAKASANTVYDRKLADGCLWLTRQA